MRDLKYTGEHEWVMVEGSIATIGISDFAQDQLIESVKAASEVYAPVSGEIVDVNDALGDDPATVNSDPTGKGWFIKIKLSDPFELDGLMDEEAYNKFTAKQG